jgi:hypothetical protein
MHEQLLNPIPPALHQLPQRHTTTTRVQALAKAAAQESQHARHCSTAGCRRARATSAQHCHPGVLTAVPSLAAVLAVTAATKSCRDIHIKRAG